ncbi:MAG: hypothetical protein WBA77_03225 [Microcoleaceae cyanobacterium]
MSWLLGCISSSIGGDRMILRDLILHRNKLNVGAYCIRPCLRQNMGDPAAIASGIWAGMSWLLGCLSSLIRGGRGRKHCAPTEMGDRVNILFW